MEYESFQSASERDHPGFDPEWIVGTFMIVGQCENPVCKQNMHGTGDYRVSHSVEIGMDESSAYLGVPYASFYSVKHLHPPISITFIPESAPDAVRDCVFRASRVFFADPSSAATALRATVESFLTSENISAVRPNGKFYNLDERLNEWSKLDATRSQVADLFSAVKWLGNAGTHDDSLLTAVEVLDGADMLGEAFHRWFTGPDIDLRAKGINLAKGPSKQP